jgi:hypothetical protein
MLYSPILLLFVSAVAGSLFDKATSPSSVDSSQDDSPPSPYLTELMEISRKLIASPAETTMADYFTPADHQIYIDWSRKFLAEDLSAMVRAGDIDSVELHSMLVEDILPGLPGDVPVSVSRALLSMHMIHEMGLIVSVFNPDFFGKWNPRTHRLVPIKDRSAIFSLAFPRLEIAYTNVKMIALKHHERIPDFIRALGLVAKTINAPWFTHLFKKF